ncbi:MAG TPA: methyltransferase [Azospirillaceae bacterium]|nr:methyltransferase [Azospirillaceae bacterium]
MTDHRDISPDQIFQVGFGFWGSKVLLSAVEIGLFTELASAPQSLASLSRRLDLHPRAAADFLDALVSMGFLARENGLYANTPTTDAYLDRSKESYVGGLLEMASVRMYPFWGSLTEALRTGLPQNEAKNGGPDPFQAIYADPDVLKGFLQAMTGISRPVAASIGERFNWSSYRTFADIGCAQGGLMTHVAARHPHLKGVGFDLPPVRPVFEHHVRSAGLQDKLRFEGGDFFVDALPEAEVLVLGHILHDWDLERKRALVAKCYEALRGGGALIVYDALIDDERRTNTFGLLMSLNMLIETPGGYDYTGPDCEGWMRAAGFRMTRTEMLTSTHGMVVGFK